MALQFARCCVRQNNIFRLNQTAGVPNFMDNFPRFSISRKTSFFNKLPAEDIWRGVTAVSNAGKKRGRGKGSGKKMARDLNKGQTIGLGTKNFIWPGLNSPIVRGNDLICQQPLSPNMDREKNILKLRDSMGSFKMIKLNPIDRGWSGAKMPGRSVGPPDGIGNDSFHSFDTRVLESKIVFIMKGNMGRKRRYSVLSVTGNGNGLTGFAMAKASDVRTALRKSKNRAGQKIMNINLFENRTVYHDFYTGFGKTKIFVSKKPEGYGLVCHRAIQTICKVVGIKDLYAKIEGSTNLQHIVKAFFIGLLKQKTYERVATDLNLHVVEYKNENSGFCQIKASPASTSNITENNYQIDFTRYILENRIILEKLKSPPFYVDSKGFSLSLKKEERFRNQYSVRLQRLVNNTK